METSIRTKQPLTSKQPISTTKSFLYFTIVTIIIIIAFAAFIFTQQSSNLRAHMMNELNQPTTLDYKHVGGTEQIHFYLATANNDEYLVRVAANSEIIDSFNLTERPDAGEYFKQHYQIHW